MPTIKTTSNLLTIFINVHVSVQGECLKDDEGHRKETSEVTVKTFIKIDPGIKLKL